MKRLLKITSVIMTAIMLICSFAACSNKYPLKKDSFTNESFRKAFSNYRFFDNEEEWMEYFYMEIKPDTTIKTIFDDGVMLSAGYEDFDSDGNSIREVHGYLVPADDLNSGENFYEHGESFLYKTHPDQFVIVDSEREIVCRYMLCNSDTFYGGYYWFDNAIIAVYAYSDGDEYFVDEVARNEVDRVLTELNLPLPTDVRN